jgi:hypothetical protein
MENFNKDMTSDVKSEGVVKILDLFDIKNVNISDLFLVGAVILVCTVAGVAIGYFVNS